MKILNKLATIVFIIFIIFTFSFCLTMDNKDQGDRITYGEDL